MGTQSVMHEDDALTAQDGCAEEGEQKEAAALAVLTDDPSLDVR
jgi:hypothetical protein